MNQNFIAANNKFSVNIIEHSESTSVNVSRSRLNNIATFINSQEETSYRIWSLALTNQEKNCNSPTSNTHIITFK